MSAHPVSNNELEDIIDSKCDDIDINQQTQLTTQADISNKLMVHDITTEPQTPIHNNAIIDNEQLDCICDENDDDGINEIRGRKKIGLHTPNINMDNRPKSCGYIPSPNDSDTMTTLGESIIQIDENISNPAVNQLKQQIKDYNQKIYGGGGDKFVESHEMITPNNDYNNNNSTISSSSSSTLDQIRQSKIHKSEPINMNDKITGCDKMPPSNVDSSDVSMSQYVNSTVSLSRQSTAFKYFKKKFKSLTFGRRNGSFFSTIFLAPEINNQIQGTYKKTSAQAIVAAIQLGIAYSVGKFSAKPDRDVLLQDFFQVEEVYFPSCGTTVTPSHRFADFTMSDYSPVAFRYFRDIFSISPEEFMTSLSTRPLRQLSNPGASGSMFFISEDDYFIIKTVDKREAKFLQQLLPGYYMNLHQNPKTLLPKFFGLYSYKYSGKNIRLVVMNNLLPSKLEFHEKYDLKGSTFKRKASQKERSKNLPTLKDLDFIEKHPNGLELSPENHQRLMRTLQRDIRVLQSYKIMDYSLLLCVHNKVIYEKNKSETVRIRQGIILQKNNDTIAEIPTNQTTTTNTTNTTTNGTIPNNNINQLSNNNNNNNNNDNTLPPVDDSNDTTFDIDQFLINGIPAKNGLGQDLILFVGIIDILQNYRLIKRTEHNLKAIVHDRDTISVHNPVFYAERFFAFCSNIFQVQNKRRAIDSSCISDPRICPTKSSSVITSIPAITKQSINSNDNKPHQNVNTNVVTVVDKNDSKCTINESQSINP